ncbi:MAG: hypothetical protein M1834_000934 [Cirrosporium novae-zelandiae]|nr:MAG: hypothetical protein M1834_000934 [Cirrosporium novae-zelandiae]
MADVTMTSTAKYSDTSESESDIESNNVEACPQPPPPSPVAGLDKSFHTEETIHPDIMKFKEPFLDQIILYKDHVFLDCIGDYYYRYMKVVVGLGVKNAKECGFQSGGLYSAESVIGRIQSTNASIDTINKVKKTLTEPLMRGYLDCQQRLKSGLRQTDMSIKVM